MKLVKAFSSRLPSDILIEQRGGVLTRVNLFYLSTRKYHFSITSMRTELVTTLKRKATELLSDIARNREPILITQHGLPSAYLVDVVSYEKLQNRMKILEGIARGEKAVEEGRILSNEEAKSKMSRWLK